MAELTHSPELIAAQKRLAALQAAARAARAAAGELPDERERDAAHAAVFGGRDAMLQALATRRPHRPHRPQTAVGTAVASRDVFITPNVKRPAGAASGVAEGQAAAVVKVYPSVWAQLNERGLESVARVYFLAKHIDADLRGHLPVDELRATFASSGAELRLFGWRRMRQVLAAGEGIAWERDGHGRLWLYSPARLLRNVGGRRVRGLPVAVPLTEFLQKHTFSAAMLSAWHAGRDSDMPISQATIRGATAVAESTQRTYNATARVRTRRNVAAVAPYSRSDFQDALYLAPNTFVMRTRHGNEIARALPNSYQSPLQALPKGRTRKINSSLVTSGARGKRERNLRVFFEDAVTAVATASKQRRDTFSLLQERQRPRRRRATVWRFYDGAMA